MDLLKYNGTLYPAFQAQGYAAQFAIPYAKKFCKGKGYDIGCMKKEWALPGAVPIDVSFDDEWDAYNLPDTTVDYIFSSHCLEHLPNWVEALDYWTTIINSKGTLFLYLPHYSQEYWRPWNNRKHIHAFDETIIKDYLVHNNYKHIYTSGPDLNCSFTVVAQKF
jgi:SAM-dependent methyltransferase